MVKDYGDKKRDLPFVILRPSLYVILRDRSDRRISLRINSEKNQYEPREESPVGTDLQVCPLRTGLKTRPYISFSVSASNQTVIASPSLLVILSPLSAHSELVEEFPLRINSAWQSPRTSHHRDCHVALPWKDSSQ
jgi:hypothetical protein